MPESVKKIMDEAKTESDSWFIRIRGEIRPDNNKPNESFRSYS